MMKRYRIQMMMACVLSVIVGMPSRANDTVPYTLAQCRELALTKGVSAQSQEEARLAAKYNRQAALAAMVPRVTANAAYMWNSKDAHLLANTTAFEFGTATVNPDGTASWAWRDGAQGRISDAAGQAIADGYKAVYDKLTIDQQVDLYDIWSCSSIILHSSFSNITSINHWLNLCV